VVRHNAVHPDGCQHQGQSPEDAEQPDFEADLPEGSVHRSGVASRLDDDEYDTAAINQAIHQLDILRWLAGPVKELFGYWQLGALHKIESEDVVNAVVRYASGATGVFQASTAFWPGYTERTEFHGTKGTAIISGDKLTTWDVENDSGEPAPVSKEVASGSSDPMAISVEPFERQFRNFGEAIRTGKKPLISGEDGYAALEIVEGVYRSCRTGEKVRLGG
jgi:predicted dehydrogenase